MHLLSIPRHQLETTPRDYLRMLAATVGLRGQAADRRRFEAEFAEYVGCRHAIAVPSARVGLDLVLSHLGIEPGCEAIVPAFNYFVVIERFLDHGIRPVFADIRRSDLNVDPNEVEALITPRTRAILATHMFGYPCDMDALTHLAKRSGLTLIEDCAHATGSEYAGRHVGTFGRAGIFSFSVLKLITTFGGGMITSNDDDLAVAIREQSAGWKAKGARKQGLKRFFKGFVMDIGTRTLPFSVVSWPGLRVARMAKPDIQRNIMTQRPCRITGWNPEPTASLRPFQIALGLAQLHRVEELIEKRQRVTAWLDEELADTGPVSLLRQSTKVRHNGMYYGILADRAQELSQYLFKHGVDTETSEYCNCAELEIYRDYGRHCPVARDVQRRIVRLPNHPALTRKDVRRIGKAIRSFYETAAVVAPSVAPAR